MDNTKKTLQQSIKSRLDQLLMEMLKIICKGKALLETEVKKKLIERLAMKMIDKVKEKDVKYSNKVFEENSSDNNVESCE
ncbi:16059_t:CDS:2 [Cetraspora pellucida]|uniref:16059_t:CDS:1 n=1 Tax=Cetraspora pellucida TaxID=1433469 RepID=A0A9N9HV01_9GLOM|nr:16059_t:CDS:2 [Cetraspora pellucida]